MSRKQLTEQHNLINDSIFRVKSTALKGKRMLHNFFSPVQKFKNEEKLKHLPVIAFSESDLWNAADNADNWILTAGKIENLRIAARQLNGLEIKAGEVFSFWKHIGNPNFGKGYVVGREIREGCIVPTIAGGLCQVSNALYDAALKANFDIIERHKHTRVIAGSLAEQDRDATVKWNYVDLRFRSAYDFRIEVELSSDKLIVSFKSQESAKDADKNITLRNSNILNDCYSCGNFACFKHPDRSSVKQESAHTTFILDEKWPEFDDYVKRTASTNDTFIVPLPNHRLFKTDRYDWSVKNVKQVRATIFAGIYRALKLRFASKEQNVFELSLALDKKIAQQAAKLIPVSSTHLVLSQNLLPFLLETGALGGRTYDVLMIRLPIEKLHQRLDTAHTLHATSPTLKDFRAPHQLKDLENKALTQARKIITPHAEIAAVFLHKSEKLEWKIPVSKSEIIKGNKILFPASALGRKGAYEVRQLAEEFQLSLIIAGSASEHVNFWKGIPVEKFNGDFSQIGLVLYPTYVEHQPRRLLKALGKEIPVITTFASGLEASQHVTLVETGHYSAFREAVAKHLS